MVLVKKGITARQVMTKEAIENAIMVLMAMGGSTNGIMHLQAIYKEAGLGHLPLEAFDRFSKRIPQIASVYPASPYDMVDFYEAGGVPGVMKELEPLLHGDCITASGKTVKENLQHTEYSTFREVIRTVAEPFHSDGGAAIPEHLMTVTGKAKVYQSEQEACEAILAGEVQPNTMVVLRYEGPKGGPGMPEMYRPMKCLEGMNLSDSCTIVTDGRFSGSNRGCFVGHISPEAYEGGNLALVEDGDEITIDVPNRKITLHVSDEELEKRRTLWKPVEKQLPDGYLNIYRKITKSAAEGAVMEME